MYVIYADELFFENLLVDYILLAATARLSGINARRLRILLAAVMGAAYALAAAVTGAEFLTAWGFKLAVGGLMVMIVFGASERLIRVFLIFFGVSAAFAGAVMAGAIVRGEGPGAVSLGRVSFGALMIAFTGFYFVFTAVFRAVARHRVNGDIGVLTVVDNGRSVEIRALYDTGNGLRDPITGLPVTVCGLDALAPVLPREAVEILSRETDAAAALGELAGRGIYSFFLVPYSAVGVRRGILPAFRPEQLLVDGKPRPGCVAIAPENLDTGAGYAAVTAAR